MSALLNLEEAWECLLPLAPKTFPYKAELSLGLASGYLARDLKALRTQPPADLSAMDGYAVSGRGPWRQVGESRAGLPFEGSIQPGECTRISTGAHVPEGAESILIQENAELDGDQVSLLAGEAPPERGRHIRMAGFDFSKDDTVLTAGTRLSPGAIGLAIAAGHDEVSLSSRPSVAVLDSGDELVPPGMATKPHQIPASNATMLASMLYPYIGIVDQLGPVPDDRFALASTLEQAEDFDILITSGGASVGDHDLIQQALIDWGAQLDFWKVAIKPGKPLMVATRERESQKQVILGLPGNPVSSFVTAFLFALPLVRAAMGDPNPLPKASTLTSAQDLPATGKRREFLRAVRDGETVRLAGSQDSSALMALAAANCLIDRPAGSGPVQAGESVPVYNLQNG